VRGASIFGRFEITPDAREILGGEVGFTIDFYAEHSASADPLQGLNFLTEPKQDGQTFRAEGILPGIRYRMRLQFAQGDLLRRLCPVKIMRRGELLRGDDIVAG